uniref:Uncharacterized protein n=1 Tax=Acrobeloides nanus TaxID=290746 RepID=A0A914D0L5_9BILA
MERLLQTFNNHQNPGSLFHRTLIRSQYIAQNAIKTFAEGHLFVEKENDTFMFKRADGWVLEIFRTEALVMVFHIAYPDENEKCLRCHNYYSFNFL